jgi:LuxR family transcriptional regulator, maltose regulon positive regulatory protein
VILEIVEKLLVHLPDNLHLVLITREDPLLPLAKMRANNQMTEVRAADLRFREQETELFLNQRMGLMLSRDLISSLEDSTEGWIVGLQLAGFSI